MENNDLNIKIEQFLDGKMDVAASAAFKREMDGDKALAEAVGMARIERLMKARMLDKYVEGKLAEWQVEDDPPPPAAPHEKAGPKNRFWLLLLLPLLAAGAWWFLRPMPIGEQTRAPQFEGQGTPPAAPATQETGQPVPVQPAPSAPEKATERPVPPSRSQPAKPDVPVAQKRPTDAELLALAAEHDYLQSAYIPHGTRGSADDLAKAEKARKAGNLEEAASLYTKIAAEDSNLGLEAAWNLGLLLFQQKKYTAAAPFFEKTANSPTFLYADDARYQLALCQLAARQFEKAKTNLLTLKSVADFPEMQQVEQLVEWIDGMQ